MKRSSILDLTLLRKRARIFVLAPISLAVITGCTGGAKEEVNFVASVDECASTTTLSEAECEAAYQEAVKDANATAPRYQNERDCTAEFGSCESRGGFFMPFMAGYIVSGLVRDSMGGNRRFNSSYPTYIYRGGGQYRNKIMTSDGFVVGSPGKSSYRMPKEALKSKPAVTRTISRGGFGASASAKSNWGSSKSSRSSSRSWGG
jgi:uncharacterized protein YgiB involved in biofilm formation